MAGLILAETASATDAQRYLPQHSGYPQGGIILRYPDVAEPIANQVSEVFTYHGWSVLLVPFTHDLLAKQPFNSINQQIAFMTDQKGQHNLVILSIGDTWDDATPLARSDSEDEPENPIRGVVLVDVPGQVLAPAELPLLDIVTQDPPVEGFQARRREARKKHLEAQQRLTLTYSTRRSTQGEDRLTRRIRGWLKHEVKGMELKDTAP